MHDHDEDKENKAHKIFNFYVLKLNIKDSYLIYSLYYTLKLLRTKCKVIIIALKNMMSE